MDKNDLNLWRHEIASPSPEQYERISKVLRFEDFAMTVPGHINDLDMVLDRATALTSLVMDRLKTTRGLLFGAFKACESPIEENLLAAMLGLFADEGYDTGICLSPDKGRFAFSLTQLTRRDVLGAHADFIVTPQFPVGNYRADFCVEYVQRFLYQHELAPRCLSDRYARLLVECDGHDYHERTREQASADKKRDRAMQAAGYRVYRFTGADIHEDSRKCATEVMESLLKIAEDDAPPPPTLEEAQEIFERARARHKNQSLGSVKE